MNRSMEAVMNIGEQEGKSQLPVDTKVAFQ